MSKIPMLAALVAAFTANAQNAVPTDIRAKVPAPSRRTGGLGASRKDRRK